MTIAPPFGYKEIVPFLKTQKVRLPKAGELPAFVRESNAVPVSFTEFQLVGREYPIVFTAGGKDKSAIAPVAVLGMVGAENLFVRDGKWESGTYVPAYVRRHPFCMARVQGAAPAEQRLICIEKGFVDETGGEAMFDDAGKPAGRWPDIEKLLSEYEADIERTREMCAILADYGLLEEFTLQATLAKDRGGAMHLTGMQRVREAALENLNAAQLKNLVRKGILARIYLHLLSLENFSRLLDRKTRTA